MGLTEHVKDFFKDVLKTGLTNIIIYAATTIFTSLMYYISIDAILEKLNAIRPLKYPIIVIGILIIIIVITLIYKKLCFDIPNFSKIESDYIILERKVNFFYTDEVSKCDIDFKLKAIANSVDRFCGKYTWSGSDPAVIKSSDPMHEVVVLTRRDSYLEYEVLFKRNYKKGQTMEFCLEFELPDSNRTFLPFLSSQIREVTKKLFVSLTIPPNYGVREIVCEIIQGTHNCNDYCRIEKLDNHGKYTWEIRKPQLLYTYSIRWTKNI